MNLYRKENVFSLSSYCDNLELIGTHTQKMERGKKKKGKKWKNDRRILILPRIR